METTALTTTQKQQVEIPSDVSIRALEMAIGQGDFSQFSPADKLRYLNLACQSIGLNPLTLPLRIIKMDNREVIYATAECSAQLSYKHKVSVKKIEEKFDHGCFMVRVSASTPDGRSYEDVGLVPMIYPAKSIEWRNGQKVYVDNPKAGKEFEGLDWANGVMKAHTKASRRAILRLCSLGVLDESELDDMPRANVTAVSAVSDAIDDSATARAERFNASLTETEKAKAVDVTVVADTPKPLDSTPPVSQAPTADGHSVAQEQPAAGANRSAASSPAVQSAATVAAPAPPGTASSSTAAPAATGPLTDDELATLESAFMACPQPKRAVDYCVHRGWIAANADLRTISRSAFNNITTKTPAFVRMVDGWKGAAA